MKTLSELETIAGKAELIAGRLRQGEIERSALVDEGGRVVLRIRFPDAYEGDLGTAAEREDAAEAVAALVSETPDLIGKLKEAEGLLRRVYEDERDQVRIAVPTFVDIVKWLSTPKGDHNAE